MSNWSLFYTYTQVIYMLIIPPQRFKANVVQFEWLRASRKQLLYIDKSPVSDFGTTCIFFWEISMIHNETEKFGYR